MNKEIIAVVRLMPGQVGFYDPLSRIHLTMGAPEKAIFVGTNVSQIKKSIRSGRLKLVSGSLDSGVATMKIVSKNGKLVAVVEPANPAKRVKADLLAVEPVKETVSAPVIEETPVAEEVEVKVEEAPAEAPSETVEEKPKKKHATRSTKKKE